MKIWTFFCLCFFHSLSLLWFLGFPPGLGGTWWAFQTWAKLPGRALSPVFPFLFVSHLRPVLMNSAKMALKTGLDFVTSLSQTHCALDSTPGATRPGLRKFKELFLLFFPKPRKKKKRSNSPTYKRVYECVCACALAHLSKIAYNYKDLKEPIPLSCPLAFQMQAVTWAPQQPPTHICKINGWDTYTHTNIYNLSLRIGFFVKETPQKAISIPSEYFSYHSVNKNDHKVISPASLHQRTVLDS